MRQNTFDKRKSARQMLIEQSIEFELRDLGPPSKTCTPKPSYFHDKTKISKENNTRVIIYSKKYCRRQCTLLLPPGPSHLQDLTPKFKILNVFWT